MMDELLLKNDNKVIFLILDGLGDIPNPPFDLKTPLEAAKKPNMDGLLFRGAFSAGSFPSMSALPPEAARAI